MAFNVTTNKINGNVVFVVSGEGKTGRFSLLDPKSANKIDPISDTTVENAVVGYLQDNSLDAVSNQKVAQGEVTRIEQRATASTNIEAGVESAFSVRDLSITDNTGTIKKGPVPFTLLSERQQDFIQKDVSSFTGEETDLGITYSPDDNNKKNIGNIATSRITLNSTIGGSDLSVYYLAEVPVMDDVLNSNIPISSWRREIITIDIDSVLSISYSILREKFPVRQLGKANPVAYTYGPRTIAGHMAFAVFTEDILMRIRGRARNEFLKATKKYKEGTKVVEKRLNELRDYYDASLELNSVQLLDSLIPFHLLVMGVNERGDFSKFLIKDVYIVDENQYQGTAQPNVLNKISYLAEDIVPMSHINGVDNISSSMELDGWENGATPLTGRLAELKGSSLLLAGIKDDLLVDHS